MANLNQQSPNPRWAARQYALVMAIIYGLGSLCSGLTEGLIRRQFVFNHPMLVLSILAVFCAGLAIALHFGQTRPVQLPRADKKPLPASLGLFMLFVGISMVIITASTAWKCRLGVPPGETEHLLLNSVAEAAGQAPFGLCNAALLFLAYFANFGRDRSDRQESPGGVLDASTDVEGSSPDPDKSA